MGRITAVENLSLDGVMQAPGRADEDERGGFAHGGWAVPFNDEVMGQKMATGMADSGLMRTLVAAGLVDQYTLLIHPIVLGGGLRLFADDAPMSRLQLIDSVTTTTGVVIATYRPEGGHDA